MTVLKVSPVMSLRKTALAAVQSPWEVCSLPTQRSVPHHFLPHFHFSPPDWARWVCLDGGGSGRRKQQPKLCGGPCDEIKATDCWSSAGGGCFSSTATCAMRRCTHRGLAGLARYTCRHT